MEDRNTSLIEEIKDEDIKKKDKEKDEDSTLKRVLIILIILAIIIILLLLCFRGCSNSVVPVPDQVRQVFDTSVDSNATEGGLTGRSKEEIQAELNEKVAASMINCSMNASPEFKDGSSEGNLNIVNNTSNNYPQVIEIYLQKEVKNDDGTTKYVDDEKIYQSGLIPVGNKVAQAKLDKDLEKGVYDCIAYFNAVRDNGEYVGKAAAKIKITVLN